MTFGESRVPLWCITGELINGEGWSGVEDGWNLSELGWTSNDFANFLYNLLEMRGEFGRLVAMLANAERVEQERSDEHFAQQTPVAGDDEVSIFNMSLEEGDGKTPHPASWWEMDDVRLPLIEQLQRCIDALADP
jgi:hypothetical protein